MPRRARRDLRHRAHRVPKPVSMAQITSVLLMAGALALLLLFRAQVAERLTNLLSMLDAPGADLQPAAEPAQTP